MKKKVVAVCATVALAAVALGGATLAYFTDSDQVNNNFTIGDIGIDLYEYADYDGDGQLNRETKFQEYLSYSNIMPGDKMAKVPVIENTNETNAAYVRVAVVMNNLDIINKSIDNVYENSINPATGEKYTAAEIQDIYDNVFDGWGVNYSKRLIDGKETGRRMWMDSRVADGSPVLFNIDTTAMNALPTEANNNTGYATFDILNKFTSENEKHILDNRKDGFLYYNLVDYAGGVTTNDGYYDQALNNDERIYVFYLKLAPGETYELFNGLNAPADFTADQMKMFEGLNIGIYADAIQVDNFDAAEDAFTALEAAHPLGWWN